VVKKFEPFTVNVVAVVEQDCVVPPGFVEDNKAVIAGGEIVNGTFGGVGTLAVEVPPFGPGVNNWMLAVCTGEGPVGVAGVVGVAIVIGGKAPTR
jgi:hypothetical protein